MFQKTGKISFSGNLMKAAKILNLIFVLSCIHTDKKTELVVELKVKEPLFNNSMFNFHYPFCEATFVFCSIKYHPEILP